MITKPHPLSCPGGQPIVYDISYHYYYTTRSTNDDLLTYILHITHTGSQPYKSIHKQTTKYNHKPLNINWRV